MSLIKIPEEVVARVARGFEGNFSQINGMDPMVLAQDILSPDKALKAHDRLARVVDPKGKRILEVGSGYGTNVVIWVKHFGLDVVGVEPEGEGFNETLSISSQLLALNGLPADRIKNSRGEELPFADSSFDIIYSANVLEHTHDPVKVLRECFRVLRPHGVLHFELPNFLSFFEGHYYVVMPPIWWRGLLPFWIQYVCRRDPAYARTLRREINPVWLRRTIRELGREHSLTITSLGEEMFRERLSLSSFQFEHEASRSKIGPVIKLLLKLNRGDLIANTLIALKAHYPIFLTVRKDSLSATSQGKP